MNISSYVVYAIYSVVPNDGIFSENEMNAAECILCGQIHPAGPHVYDFIDDIDDDICCSICLSPFLSRAVSIFTTVR